MKPIKFLSLSLTIVVTLLLGGCMSNFYKQQETSFFPSEDNEEFIYRTQCGTWSDPPEDPRAEANRLKWLDEYLRDNDMCPGNYQITKRRVITTLKTNRGSRYLIDYKGKCNFL